jgi:hypothetical protein
MSGNTGVGSRRGEFAAEREGFRYQWRDEESSAKFDALLRGNVSAAIEHYKNSLDDMNREMAAGAEFQKKYEWLHPHSTAYLRDPFQLRHDNRTWGQIAWSFANNVLRDWGWASQTPRTAAHGIGSSPYGHHVYGSNGTVPYAEPEMAQGGTSAMVWPFVALGVLSAAYVYRRLYSGGAGTAEAIYPPSPHQLELGEPFLPVMTSEAGAALCRVFPASSLGSQPNGTTCNASPFAIRALLRN